MTQNDVAIKVAGLSKLYKTYNRRVDMVKEVLTGKKYHGEHWALKDVSFEVKRGQVVGIIGSNGAGKSTLLKIIAGTLEKTEGMVNVNGSISAILELGTGFHPQYTGRENIIMGGMCLGLTKKEIQDKSDWIIKFSELEKVIDQPFQTYSSGMQARLTFSTAICTIPDVFIVDEALAAGDAFFVSKCISRIQDICSSGSTVLFVSHSTDIVKRLCSTAIYINEGEIQRIGNAIDVCTFYESLILKETSERNRLDSDGRGEKLSSDVIRIKEIKLLDKGKQEVYSYYQHEEINIGIVLDVLEEIENPAVFVKITRSDGVIATSWLSHEPEFNELGRLTKNNNKINVCIEDIKLGDGKFFFTIALFPYRDIANSGYYADPLCMWDRVVFFDIKRKTRPLSTIYDQVMKLG